MKCDFHEGYSLGRYRRSMLAGATRPTCHHIARWILTQWMAWLDEETGRVVVTSYKICALHRRSIDAIFPLQKNDPGRWLRLTDVIAAQ